ncbi:GntR family transcriptional regulator, partial [Mesorhizobium sp. M1A.F.Ca.IN.020.32.1.1]
EEFGVSAITIKRALRDLQAAGVLVSVAGKGTYVKKRQKKVVRKLDVHFPNYEGATIKLIATTREIITDPTLNAFNIPKSAMLCIRKMIFLQGAPFMYDATFISPDIGEDIIEEFGGSFVVNALKQHDIHVIKTDLMIDAAPAVGEVEEEFRIPTGYPMLRRSYKYTTSEPNIIVYGVAQAPFDQLTCSLSILGSPIAEG